MNGLGGCAARDGVQHRGLDLKIAAAIKKAADLPNDLGTLDKGFLDLGAGNQIDVALTIAQLSILQAVPLVGKRKQRFGKQAYFPGMNRNFPLACAEDKALNPDDITDIPGVERRISLLAHIVDPDIDLHPAARVPQVDETGLAHVGARS